MIDQLLTFAIDMLAAWYQDQSTINSEFATSDEDYKQTELEYEEHIKRLADISGLMPEILKDRVKMRIYECT